MNTTTTDRLLRPALAVIACGLALGLTACGDAVAPAQQVKIDGGQTTTPAPLHPPIPPLAAAAEGSADEHRLPGALPPRPTDVLP